MSHERTPEAATTGTESPVWKSRTWMKASGLLAILMLFLLATGYDDGGSTRVTVTVIGVAALLVIIGANWRTSRQRRVYHRELTEWTAAQAVQAERMRIARELHDLASHGLGTITLRAAAGRVSGEAPGYLQALVDIEETSRQATLELRRMLRLLRGSAGVPVEFHPVEDLSSLPEIISAAEGRRLRVTAEIEDTGNLSAGAQLAICSVVREGLVNASRYAGDALVHVGIARLGGQIRVEIADSGPREGWSRASGAGYGLIGLRERIAVLGGEVETGRRDGGFVLAVTIPGEDAR
ncbi:histidine kinase [Actinomycetaceae bacterium L2_0104]